MALTRGLSFHQQTVLDSDDEVPTVVRMVDCSFRAYEPIGLGQTLAMFCSEAIYIFDQRKDFAMSAFERFGRHHNYN